MPVLNWLGKDYSIVYVIFLSFYFQISLEPHSIKQNPFWEVSHWVKSLSNYVASHGDTWFSCTTQFCADEFLRGFIKRAGCRGHGMGSTLSHWGPGMEFTITSCFYVMVLMFLGKEGMISEHSSWKASARVVTYNSAFIPVVWKAALESVMA